MVAHYPGVELHLLEGSDHAVSDFEQHQDRLLHFLGLPTNPDGETAPLMGQSRSDESTALIDVCSVR